MTNNWWPILALLLAAAGAASAAAFVDHSTEATKATEDSAVTTTQPSPPPQTTPPQQPPRNAEVIVIDVTKNTSSIISIPIEGANNLTSAQIQQRKDIGSLRCLTQHKANLFLLVHLNRNWRQKLHFVRQLLSITYEQSSTNVAIVFFNEFTSIVATFGTDPLSSQAEMLAALARVQAVMERDESGAVSEHWTHFRLEDALKACYRYASLFLHQFSLDARPSILFSYFDDGAVISDVTLNAVDLVQQEYKSANPFAASVSILQWPSSLPVPPQWARVSELLSSSPSHQVTGATEDNILGFVAELVANICKNLPNA